MLSVALLRRRRNRLTIGTLAVLLAASASLAPGAAANAAVATQTVSGTVTDAVSGSPMKSSYVSLVYGPTGASFADSPVSASGTYSLPLPRVSGSPFSIEVRTYDDVHANRTTTSPFTLTTTTASFSRNVAVARGATLTGHIDPPSTNAWRDAAAYDTNGTYGGSSSSVADDGSFTITGLPAGSYKVLISGQDFASEYMGGGASFAAAPTFQVAAGQTVDTGTNTAASGATISGRVTTSPGGTAEQATVTLTEVGAPAAPLPPNYSTYLPYGTSTYTDNDGAYTFDNVAPGTYTLRFSASNSGDNHVGEYYPGTTYASQAEKLVVTGTESITRDLALPVGGSITGTVKGDGSRATFTSIAYAKDPGTGQWQAQSSGTAWEGDPSYTIPGLAPGTYKVGFTSFSTSAIFAGEYYNDARTIDSAQSVTVRASAATPGIDAVLTAGGPAAAFATHPLPVITGKAAVRSTLTAVPGTWSPAVTAFTYQWKRDGTSIPGATKSSYALLGADAGKAITVTVTGARAGYTTLSQTSAATARVAPGLISLSSVKTAGTHAVGATQKASVVVQPASAALTFQWLRGGAKITGATKSSYKLAAADGGKAISVLVTAKIPGYTTASKSSASFVPLRALTKTPAPKIVGKALVGKRLSVSVGTWSPAPVAHTFQWKRNGVSIPKATKSTYTPTSADRGKKLTVVVSGVKSGYSRVAKSSSAVSVK